MKSLPIPCAGLLTSGITSAPSSVALFGVVDAAINSTINTSRDTLGNEVKVIRTAGSSSGNNAGRIDFRGTGDLGGRLPAGFCLDRAHH